MPTEHTIINLDAVECEPFQVGIRHLFETTRYLSQTMSNTVAPAKDLEVKRQGTKNVMWRSWNEWHYNYPEDPGTLGG